MPHEENMDAETLLPANVSIPAPDVYPGPLAVWKNLNLTDEEQRIEREFAEQLQADLTGWMTKYLERNGRILDTDLARTLSTTWNKDNASRARLTSAVHNPASAFINALYEELLKQETAAEQDTVLFMAGGGGSGKTTAMKRLAALLDRVYLTYNTTLSRLEPAQEKIEAALAANKNVLIVFVYRPFEAAVGGVIDRAMDQGRAVPLNVLAADHVGAPQTTLQLAERYANNPKVRVIVISNSGDIDSASIIDPDNMRSFLQDVAYTQVQVLIQNAQEVLDREIISRQGTIRDIPEYIVEALNRVYVRRAR